MVFNLNAHIAAQARHDVAIIDEALRSTLDGVAIVRLRMLLAGKLARQNQFDAFLERMRSGTMTREDRSVLQKLRDDIHQHGVHAEEMCRRARAQGVRY
jgi:hypothetical protein